MNFVWLRELGFFWGLVALGVLSVLTWLLRPYFLAWWETAKSRLFGLPKRLTKIWLNPSASVWETDPIPDLTGYSNRMLRSVPSLLVANLKGGVGKTTLAAHLIGYFASRGERVLAIDLDFQGSLSTTLLAPVSGMQSAHAKSSAMGDLIAGRLSPENYLQHTHEIKVYQPGTVHLLSAFLPLEHVETNELALWLAGKKRDLRYVLAEYIHSDAIKKNFDRVIIDAPPRLTTACVQGLCAATHLLIPTSLDHMSAEPVSNFLANLEAFRAKTKICPNIKVAGVVGTMVQSLTPFDPKKHTDANDLRRFSEQYEIDEFVAIGNNLSNASNRLGTPVTFLPLNVFIPEEDFIHKTAAKKIAFAADVASKGRMSSSDQKEREHIKEMFAGLGEEIRKRMT